MATVTLTQGNFEATMKDNPIVVVDFWASWCGPCRTFAPTFEAAAEKHPDIVFGKVDTEAEQDLAGHYQIQSIPTLMIVRDELVLYSQPGALPEAQLESLIQQVRDADMNDVRKQLA